MRCPYCLESETQVKDSRATDESTAVRRRRLCVKCGGKFTTFERVQVRDLKVVKSNGNLQIFDRDKLSRSITIACRKRHVSENDLEKILSGIVRQVELSGEYTITTDNLGALVMAGLKQVDSVAYVRYASVYKNFEAPNEFVKFINTNTDDT